MSDQIGTPKVPVFRENFYVSSPGVLLLGLLLGLVAFLAGILPLWHTDFWGHLRFGETILEQGLFEREPISPFTDPSLPYMHFYWLTQILYALVFHAGSWLGGETVLGQFRGGVEAIRLMHALLCSLLFLLIYLGARGRGATVGVAVLAVLFALLFSLGTLLYHRPQLFGAIGFAGLLAILARPPLSRWGVVGAVVVLVLWANLHGSYVLGLVVLGVLAVGRGLDVLTGEAGSLRGVLGDVELRRLVLALILSVFAIALLNPHGPMLYVHVLLFSRNPNLATVGEWQPLQFHWGGGGHIGWLVVVVVVLLSRGLARTRFTWGERFLLVLFLALPFHQQRMQSWLAFLLPWILARFWQRTRERINEWGWLNPAEKSIGYTLLGVGIYLVGLGLIPAVRGLVTGNPPGTLASAVSGPTPVELGLRWREKPPGTIFTAEQGDFLFWAMPTGSRICLTTHVHLFPPDHWARCTAALQAKPGWEKTLDDLRVEVVLLDPTEYGPLATALARDPRWRVEQAGRTNPRIFLARRVDPPGE